jgi:uncharacterized integral membrane protein (TIGR00697 family)
MDDSVYHFIAFLENFSPEFLSFLTFIVCAVAILGMLRFYGAAGLCVYNAVAVLIANIQVLRLAKFGFSPEPVALGTVVFATVFLVSDILVEHYGTKVARDSLWLSFISQILMTIIMILTLGHAPLEGTELSGTSSSANAINVSMVNLFAPSPRLLCASLWAYVVSQLFDIWVFQKIRNLSHGRFVWLRQNVSTLLSGLLDSFVFGYISWMILSPTPISFRTLMITYVFGTYFLRLIVNLAGTPIIYLSYRMLRKS